MSAAAKVGSIRGDSMTRHCVLLAAADLAFAAATRLDATLAEACPDGAVTDVRLPLRGPGGALLVVLLLPCLLRPPCLLLFKFAAVLPASSFLYSLADSRYFGECRKRLYNTMRAASSV